VVVLKCACELARQTNRRSLCQCDVQGDLPLFVSLLKTEASSDYYKDFLRGHQSLRTATKGGVRLEAPVHGIGQRAGTGADD